MEESRSGGGHLRRRSDPFCLTIVGKVESLSPPARVPQALRVTPGLLAQAKTYERKLHLSIRLLQCALLNRFCSLLGRRPPGLGLAARERSARASTWQVEGDGQSGHGTRRPYRDAPAQRPGARRGRI